MSYTTYKLLKEFRQRLNEDETTDKLSSVLKTSGYEQFVAKLGDAAEDSKVQAVLAAGTDDGNSADEKIALNDAAVAVTDLKPTQNEIALDKSLKFPLTDPASAAACLKGGTVAIAGKRIVTAEQKYIIDGHHRWSQLYAMNKDAKIASTDMTAKDIKNPIDFLKLTQIAIAADLGKVPTQTAKGSINLITISEKELKSYVIETITDPVIEQFKKYKNIDTKESIADYIWDNVKSMQSTSVPVPGAPKRDFMPQTDDATNWQQMAAAGALNYKSPFKLGESIDLNRWKRIANINTRK